MSNYQSSVTPVNSNQWIFLNQQFTWISCKSSVITPDLLPALASRLMTSCCHYPGLSFEISAVPISRSRPSNSTATRRHCQPIKYDSLHAFSSSMLLFLRPSTFPSPPGRRRFTKLHHFTSQSVSAELPPPASGLHGGTFPCRHPSITKISPQSPSANYHISSAVTHVIITASTRLRLMEITYSFLFFIINVIKHLDLIKTQTDIQQTDTTRLLNHYNSESS